MGVPLVTLSSLSLFALSRLACCKLPILKEGRENNKALTMVLPLIIVFCFEYSPKNVLYS
jgi:hypothetical protein